MALAATFISSSVFSVVGDVTGLFRSGRKVRYICASIYRYGYVSSSAFDGTKTTIYLDSAESESVTPDIISVDVSVVKSNIMGEGNLPLEYVWLLRGQQTIRTTYKNTNSITLNPGIVHINNDILERVYHCSGFDITLSSLNVNQWYYIYVQSPTSGVELTPSEISYNSTAPILNSSKQGYYHSVNTYQRCIGFIYAISSSEILPFLITGRNYRFTDIHLTQYASLSLSTSWLTTTATPVPIGDIEVFFSINASTGHVFSRTTGTVGSGFEIKTNSGTVPYAIVVNSDKTYDLRTISGTYSIFIFINGFILPDGI